MPDEITDGPCPHAIWRYCGADYWGDYDETGNAIHEQRHQCIDCGREERDVPCGAVMVGHAPGECRVCDKAASSLSPEQRDRWINLTLG